MSLNYYNNNDYNGCTSAHSKVKMNLIDSYLVNILSYRFMLTIISQNILACRSIIASKNYKLNIELKIFDT